jgi:predicted metal-dependent phosphoesterase TrpH
MFRYETHLHTSPVSACSWASVEESLKCYKDLGYDGVFITNHFLDGNINFDKNRPYEEGVNFYFSDYEAGVEIGEKLGIKVFPGVEFSYHGTDFLVYGLDKAWFLAHPEIMNMKKSDELRFMKSYGALIIQAHPFRQAGYIDHIRLFPDCVDGVEIINASQWDEVNQMAKLYADMYGLIHFAGSDNHSAEKQRKLAGISTEEPIFNVDDFIDKVLSGKTEVFSFIRE